MARYAANTEVSSDRSRSEFLSNVALPDGRTVGEWVGPQLAQVYARQAMPALLPGSADA